MDRKYAEYLLNKTKKDYNLIAKDYARTRAYIPEDIKSLVDYAKEGDKVLDSGCANGRLSAVLKGVEYFGVDISEELVKIAKIKYPEANFQVADVLTLPFSDNFFDKVYSVSVLHHIPSKDFHLRYLKESKRALKPGGILILRVWDFWKRKSDRGLIFKYTFLRLMNKSKLDFKDIFRPWRESDRSILVERYFHCFTKRELNKLAVEAGFKIKKIWRAGKDPHSNIYLIAQKPS